MPKAKKEELFNFETGMEELETILEKISSPDTSLQESIDLYAKAADLINSCNETLQKAQIQIDEIGQKLISREDKDDI